MSLQRDNNQIASLSAINKEKPQDGIFIKGTVKEVNQGNDDNQIINIEYGIESYFVPENKGSIVEKNLENTYAKIVVDKFGNAIVKALVLNGEEIQFTK